MLYNFSNWEFNMSLEKVKLEEEGYDYFDNLPNEVVLLIFTKLSNAAGGNTLKEVKSLGQCLTLNKRFNSLTRLVPTLSISHPSITVLRECCPKILKTFNHICSLRVEYKSDSKGTMSELNKNIPHIYCKATYDPLHYNYSLAVITCTDLLAYPDECEYYPLPKLGVFYSDDGLIKTTRSYISSLFCLHHMLCLSIRNLKLIQKVSVSDFLQRESFTLVEEQLIELKKDIATTNLAQFEGSQRGEFYDIFNLPLSEDHGLVLKNVTFCLFRRLGSSTHIDEDYIPELDGSGKFLQKALKQVLGLATENLFCFGNEPKVVFEGEWF